MPYPHQAQLITYADSLGANLDGLVEVLDGPLGGVFPGGVHLLPPFVSSGDRGFAPLGYDTIEPTFGTWTDITRLSQGRPVTLDIMVNHISRESVQFKDFQAHGRLSEFADCFLTLDKVFPDGEPQPGDMDDVFLRKPEHPFLTVDTGPDGTPERIWATFGPRVDWADQVDLDPHAPSTKQLYSDWFASLAARGVSQIRLDAVGYLTKAPGTKCFMNEPEIWDHLQELSDMAGSHGVSVLPEIHAGATMHRRLAERGYLSYDFALPGIILHALISGTPEKLIEHLSQAPAHQVTMLDCHDGIPMHPDCEEVLSTEDIAVAVEHCVANGANINAVKRTPGDAPDSKERAHQINCTYRDAIGNDNRYLAARAIQLFAPGTPQIYYVGLLGGRNVEREPGNDGREVNRYNFSRSEVVEALAANVVKVQLALLEHRNHHPAFRGTLDLSESENGTITMIWTHGEDWSRLDVDVPQGIASVSHTGPGGTVHTLAATTL